MNYEFYMVTPLNCFACLNAADRGDRTAQHSLLAMAKALKQIRKGKRKTLCMCLDCEVEFSENVIPLAFVIALPMFPFAERDSEFMIVNCICARCLMRDDLDDAVLRTWREMWPDSSFHEMTLQ